MMQRTRPEKKAKGVLLPVFSLPSKYGTGCFSEEAKGFVDMLQQTGHTYWQILPLNPTGVADSPYQPLSSFAGNAYFIDPVQLVAQGLLSQEELDGFDFGKDPSHVDYEALFESRLAMLKLAYGRFEEKRQAGEEPDDFGEFLRENDFWLEDYVLFMTLREHFGRELSWDDWPEELRRREPEALARAREEHAETVGFYRWRQYEFYRQWGELKEYANARGIKIIGDMPVYVSYDSSDCWAAPDQFQLGEDLLPKLIAGVPPDGFSDEGQLWGNPLYDWERMKTDGYAWWISRIQQSFRLYDVIRLDHFRGYEAYYSCDAAAENAMHGFWRKGPGLDLFRQLEEVTDAGRDAAGKDGAAGRVPLRERFIAEDLGFLTENVHRLLWETGFPGTRVLQFAFDGDPGNLYLPENFRENCVVYTGTHDNDTTAGWFRSLSSEAQAGILQYLGLSAERAWYLILEWDHAQKTGHLAEDVEDPAIVATRGLVDKALDSRANLAIIPLQDYLLLGSEARVNVPGTVGSNWAWRVSREM